MTSLVKDILREAKNRPTTSTFQDYDFRPLDGIFPVKTVAEFDDLERKLLDDEEFRILFVSMSFFYYLLYEYEFFFSLLFIQYLPCCTFFVL